MIRAAAAALLALLAAAPSAGAAVRETPVPILIYHHIAKAPRDAEKPALFVERRLFARQVAALDRAGWTAVTMEEAWRHWEEGAPLPAKPVVLSFDDGFTNQFRNAAPVLRARGWPGVLNLQTVRVGVPGGLTQAQIERMLRDGWELGAHSVSHPDLRKVSRQRLRDEVRGSRTAIQQLFGVVPDFFCYPYGYHDARVRQAVLTAGFLAATTTRRGAASPSDGRFELDRMVVTGNFPPARLLRALDDATSGAG